MHCDVYKSLKKDGMYLFVPHGSDTADLPEALLDLIGELGHVLDVDLADRQKLGRSQPEDVITGIHDNGFYLQMPPGKNEPDWLQ